MTEFAVTTALSWAPSARAACAPRQIPPGQWARTRYYWGVALILTLAVVNCFWRLSSSVISDLDEARYGVSASEMLRSHSALVATYAGRPEFWNLKPPLGYWLQEASFKLFGPTVFALRFPAALCALAIVALTMSACRRWYGRRAALLAGLIIASCFGLISHHGSRSGDLDSALTLIVLVAMMQVPRLHTSSAARLTWAGTFALGFLLKSFAILPFVAPGLCCLLWCSDGHGQPLRARAWLPAALLFAGVVLAWIAARCWVDGSTYFVKRMLLEDLLQRSTQTIDQETYKPLGYFAVLLDRFAPWPLFILASLTVRERPTLPVTPGPRLVLLWALLPLLAFTLARTQHHWYLDPSYPAWSMLAAVAILKLLSVQGPIRRHLLVGLVAVSLLFCESRVLFRVLRTDRRPASQTFLLSLKNRSHLPSDTIVAAFPLSHSERFILQVIDGFAVAEPELPPNDDLPDHILVLTRRQQASAIWARHPQARIVSAGAGYLLFEDASADLGAEPR